jgi:hypothetical protein
MYDWVIDIDLVNNIAKEGWKIFLSEKFQINHSSMFDFSFPIETDSSLSKNVFPINH